jgi:hypothetical protein
VLWEGRCVVENTEAGIQRTLCDLRWEWKCQCSRNKEESRPDSRFDKGKDRIETKEMHSTSQWSSLFNPFHIHGFITKLKSYCISML